jgi:molecular chaperone DnaK (HSP70)
MSRPVLGIDLGTPNSVVASIDDQGTVVILRDALGSEITPSAVYFDPDGGSSGVWLEFLCPMGRCRKPCGHPRTTGE